MVPVNLHKYNIGSGTTCVCVCVCLRYNKFEDHVFTGHVTSIGYGWGSQSSNSLDASSHYLLNIVRSFVGYVRISVVLAPLVTSENHSLRAIRFSQFFSSLPTYYLILQNMSFSSAFIPVSNFILLLIFVMNIFIFFLVWSAWKR